MVVVEASSWHWEVWWLIGSITKIYGHENLKIKGTYRFISFSLFYLIHSSFRYPSSCFFLIFFCKNKMIAKTNSFLLLFLILFLPSSELEKKQGREKKKNESTHKLSSHGRTAHPPHAQPPSPERHRAQTASSPADASLHLKTTPLFHTCTVHVCVNVVRVCCEEDACES